MEYLQENSLWSSSNLCLCRIQDFLKTYSQQQPQSSSSSKLGYVFILVFNPFVPNALILYPLKTSENLTFFCFQGVEKGCIGNKWVHDLFMVVFKMLLLHIIECFQFKDPPSGLRQFLANENSLKMMKNTFYFTLKLFSF